MNNLFPNSGSLINKGERETKSFLKRLRSDLEHLDFIGAGHKLEIASNIVVKKVPKSLGIYLTKLQSNISGRRMASSMSVISFDAAIARAIAEVTENRARQANKFRRNQEEKANNARRASEEARAKAERNSARRKASENANRVHRQAEANARAAVRIAAQREREAEEARRAANAAREAKRRENEARNSAAELERLMRSRPRPNRAESTRQKNNKSRRQANMGERLNAAKLRARQAMRARASGETPGVVRRPGAATRANFNTLRGVQFASKNAFNNFLGSVKNGGGRSAYLKAKVKYAPMQSNESWALNKINRAWSKFYRS